MELLELICASGSRGLGYDELVEKSGMTRAAVGVEVMHLISAGKVERSDGLYFARGPQLQRTETPSVVAATEDGDRMENTKRCPRCRQTKPVDQFRSNGYCKPCGKQYDDASAKAKAPSAPGAVSSPVVAENRAKVARPESKVEPAAPSTPSIEDRFRRQPEASSSPSETAGATARQQIERDVAQLLLPSRQRIAAALEERDGQQVVQIASDFETVIEATPEQMDAICAWWAKIRVA